MHTLRQAARPGELERVPDDPVHALPGVHFLLDGNLVFGPGLEPAADADVQPLGVLAEHDEVDVLAAVRPFSGHSRSCSSLTGR